MVRNGRRWCLDKDRIFRLSSTLPPARYVEMNFDIVPALSIPYFVSGTGDSLRASMDIAVVSPNMPVYLYSYMWFHDQNAPFHIAFRGSSV